MSFTLIRRTNYPLEGEGTRLYNVRTKSDAILSHDYWIQLSKTYHMGPCAGGTFWALLANKWWPHKDAIYITLEVYERTYDKYDIYVKPFCDTKWVLLAYTDEYSNASFHEVEEEMGDTLEFYLVERFHGVIHPK